jgi:two-component system sensor histidine kinase YesM
MFFYQTYKKDMYELNSSLLSSASSNIENYLNDLSILTMVPYAYPELLNYMKEIQYNNPEMKLATRYRLEQMYKDSITKIMYLNRNDITAILFIPINVEKEPSSEPVIIAKNSSDITTFESDTLPTTQWFQDTLLKNGTSCFFYISDLNYTVSPLLKSSVFFSAARLIKDVNTDKPIGVLRVDVHDINLTKIFNNIDIKENNNLLLLDENQELIYSKYNINPKIVPLIKEHQERIYLESTYSVQYHDLPNGYGILVSLNNQNEIIRLAITIISFSVVATLFFLLVSLSSYKSSSHSMVSSINQIIHVLEQVEQGTLTQKVNIKGNNQLAIIGKALNHMIDRLQLYINNEFIAVIKRKEIEYLTLQSQINPHFLYNVLNGIAVMNRLGEKGMVDEEIINLTKLMRYSCNRDSECKLIEECDFITRYLQLQKIRFSDRLQYEIKVDKSVENSIIPKLLLQPLVENSIVHGMEPYDKQVKIRLEAFYEQDRLNIVITDNGVGFDVENEIASDSIGLTNVKNRLLLYDTTSIFVINSSPSLGTEIKINLNSRR